MVANQILELHSGRYALQMSINEHRHLVPGERVKKRRRIQPGGIYVGKAGDVRAVLKIEHGAVLPNIHARPKKQGTTRIEHRVIYTVPPPRWEVVDHPAPDKPKASVKSCGLHSFSRWAHRDLQLGGPA